MIAFLIRKITLKGPDKFLEPLSNLSITEKKFHIEKKEKEKISSYIYIYIYIYRCAGT